MILWLATMLGAALPGPIPGAAIELRSIAPAAVLVPCIGRALAKAGTIVTLSIEHGTQIDVLGKAADPATTAVPAFSIRIVEAAPQRVIRATYAPPVTAKLAHRLMAQAARECFAQEWRAHEWERH